MEKPLYERTVTMLLALPFMAALMLHACWNAPFYSFDDDDHIRLGVMGPWTDSFKDRLEIPLMPATFLSYRLDYAFFGPKVIPRSAPSQSAEWRSFATAVRVINAFYHVLAGAVLWVLLCRLGAGAGIAALVALVWTGHPMACESVCWISERKNVLAALFGFLALLAWTFNRSRIWRWPLIWMLYGMAMLSKPSAIGLLPVLAALEIFLGSPQERFSKFTLLKRLSIPILITLAIAHVTIHGHELELVDPPGGSLRTAILTDFVIFTRYVLNIIMPLNLSFFYAVEPAISLADYRVWLCGALLAILFTGAYFDAEKVKQPLVLLGTVWFFGALGPVSNLLAIPYWMQDRYAYLAAAGALLAFAVGVQGALRHLPPAARALPGYAFVLLIGILVARRSELFKSSDTLYFDAANRQPKAGFARLNTGKILAHRLVRHLPDGTEPNAELAQTFTHAAMIEFESAQSCPDIQNFSDPLSIKSMEAGLLITSGHFDEARQLLKDWLPPANMPLLPEKGPDGAPINYNRRTQFSGYTSNNLAHAWSLMAEANLRKSAMPGLAYTERQALCEQALKETDKSIQIHLNDYEAYIVKARVLMQQAGLENGEIEHEPANKLEIVRQKWGEAMSVLKAVPASSYFYSQAQKGLAVRSPVE